MEKFWEAQTFPNKYLKTKKLEESTVRRVC